MKQLIEKIGKYKVPIVAIIGILVLFFFPEPETNFLAYIATAIFFIVLVAYLLRNYKKNNGK